VGRGGGIGLAELPGDVEHVDARVEGVAGGGSPQVMQRGGLLEQPSPSAHPQVDRLGAEPLRLDVAPPARPPDLVCTLARGWDRREVREP
jgi:hypothetical protein